MSVVRVDRGRRWLLVSAAAVAVVGVPSSWSTLATALERGAGSGPPSGRAGGADLVRRILASAAVPHRGLVTSRGGISLPDVPGLAATAALVGGTVRARLWWRSSRCWRVDTLSLTGEQGLYAGAGSIVTWDYERDTLSRTPRRARLRLPRVDDLLPPQLARRLLGGLGARDRLEVSPGTRSVAGRRAWLLTITPGDSRSTLSSILVEVDAPTGLPLSVAVRGPDGGDALVSRFEEVSFGRPPDAVLSPPAAPTAQREWRGTQDLAEVLEQAPDWPLPDRLAGFPRSASLVEPAPTYGEGLARFVVLAIPSLLAAQIMDAARSANLPRIRVPGGEQVRLHGGVLAVVAAVTTTGPLGSESPQSLERAFLVCGPIRLETLTAAAAALLATPATGS